MMDRDALDNAWYVIKHVTRSLENMKPYYTNWGTDVDQILKKADDMDKKAKGKMALVIAVGGPQPKDMGKDKEKASKGMCKADECEGCEVCKAGMCKADECEGCEICEEKEVKKEFAPDYNQKEGSKIGPSHFVTETGGQTQTAHYWTNNYGIESEDVKRSEPKPESSKALDNHNQHYPTSQSTLDSHVNDSGDKGVPTALNKGDILKRVGESLF
tara:strand:+ start:5286 stop:5930 length:645 start_codon:yes stop_codon:yes gene_type:complete